MTKKIDWIIVPGGPGLSQSYLAPFIRQALPEENLYSYDPLGAPESIHKHPTIENMVNQIAEVANHHQLTSFGLITHSFGNYLAMRLLEKESAKIEALIMLNPMPFTFSGYKKSIEKINASIAQQDQEAIQQLSQNPQNGSALFKKLLPYYSANKNINIKIDVPFDVTACYTILNQLSDYDDQSILDKNKIPNVMITGDKDPFYDEDQILRNNTVILDNIGHFPFLEDFSMFSAIMQETIRSSF